MNRPARAPVTRAAFRKEILHCWRDRSLLLLVFVGPLLLAAITTLAFRNISTGNAANIGVVSTDSGGITATLVNKVMPSVAVGRTDIVRPVIVSSYSQAVQETREGKLAAAIVIPANFTAQITAGRNPAITLITGSDNSVGVPVAQSVVQGFVAQIVANRLGVHLAVTGPHATHVTPALLSKAENLPPLITITTTDVGASTVQPVDYIGPSMLMLALFFCGQIAARALVSERRRGTLSRILMTGVPLRNVLLAKYITAFLVAAASAVVLLGALSIFGARFGPLGALTVLVALTAAAMVGVSSLIVLAARTEEQAVGLSTVAVFVLALLGGNFVPLSHIPPLLSKLALLTPNGWALRGFAYLSLAPSDPFSAIAQQLIVLACFALAAGIPAIVLSRRMARRPHA
jgi:ABC-2 type transport system permease protein